MKGIDILHAIGEVDEELIIECDSYKIKKYPSFMYIAACIAVCAISAAVYTMNQNDISHIDVTEPVPSSIATEKSDISENDDPITVSSVSESVTTITVEMEENDSSAITEHTSETQIIETETENITVTSVPESVTAITADTEVNESSDYVSEAQIIQTETSNSPSETTTENMPTSSSCVTENVIIPHWNELSESDKYPYFMYNNTEYHMTNTYYSSDEVEFLFNDCIYGIDEYTNERHEKQVSVYTIKNTDENYAVAIRIDDDLYRKYGNSGYAPKTLGEYLNGTDLLNRYDICRVQIKTDELFDPQTEQVYYIEYIMEDTSKLITSLFSDNLDAPQETNYSMTDLSFLDDGNLIFSIRGGKYISFGGNCYNIGEEAVLRLIEEIKSFSEEKTIYLNSSTDIADIPE